MTDNEREELIDELTKTLIILGVTWNPRPVARGLIDKNYRKITQERFSTLGHWEHYSTTMMECSVCKKHVPKHRYKYCPECGSKMVPKVTVKPDSEEAWEQLTFYPLHTGRHSQ